MHNEKLEERKSQHIKCPICSEERKEILANHYCLIQHLYKVHNLSIEQCNCSFRNMEEFEAWRTQEGKEVDYAYTASVNRPNGEKSIYYNYCNRSNSKGWELSVLELAPISNIKSL
jgi:C4-type Zn-finger protein